MPVETGSWSRSLKQRYFASPGYTLHVPNIGSELSPLMKDLVGKGLTLTGHSLVKSVYSAAERLAEDPRDARRTKA